MTEKRFTLNSNGGVYAIEDNKENIGCSVVNESSGMYLVDLLNELSDENTQLKTENERLSILNEQKRKTIKFHVDGYNQLKEENEQLKSDVQMCREKALYWRNKAEDIFGDMKTNIELKQENEQLKRELTHKKVLLNSLQDKYSGLLKLVHGFGDVDD